MVAKLFWKDGTEIASTARRCLKKVGQKNISGNTTNMHWKTTPMKPHLEKGDDGKKNWHIVFNKEGKQGPIRQRPDFREAKHPYRQLFKEHVESTTEGNKSIHPAQPTRHNYRQQHEGSDEYTNTIHPRTGWKYYPSASSSSSSQWQQKNEWKSNQSWDYWRSSTWTEL